MASFPLWLSLALMLLLAALALLAWKPGLALRAVFAAERRRAHASIASLDAAGHRWRYFESGAAGDAGTLVLVHGFTGFKENWLPLMRRLYPRHRILAPDLPGWGESERRADADYGYAAQAERLAAFLRATTTAPVALVGHSMGGAVAALLAARHPRLVARLVLMDAAGVRFDDNEFGLAILRGEHPFGVGDRGELRRYLALLFERPPRVPWPASAALVRRRRADADFEQAVLAALRGDEAFLPGEEAAKIRVPTLLLWNRDDRVIDASAARLYAERLPDARIVLLDGGGHMPMMERPADTARAIEEFLR